MGTIIDASTGEPLPTSDMWLYRDDMPDNRFFTSADRTARFLLALPDLSYSLEVTHEGYKPWRSDEDGEQIPSQHLRIKSGEELRLTIRLQPVERTRR